MGMSIVGIGLGMSTNGHTGTRYCTKRVEACCGRMHISPDEIDYKIQYICNIGEKKMKKEVEYSVTQSKLVELGNPPARTKTKYVHNDGKLQRLA